MDFSQENKPSELVYDIDEKSLSPSQAFYLKNREYFTNVSLPGGQTVGKSTPLPANYKLCDLIYPAGENYSIGSHSSKITNEVYVFVFNSNAVNFIYRIDVKGCQIVYDEPCLGFSANPRNSIEDWRVVVDVDLTCRNWDGKRLIWADGENIGCIDVEASIATNSFTTPFFDTCNPDPCDMARLCVPSPCGCPQFEWIENSGTDNLKNNKLVDTPYQFMFRWIYYDGRKSDWSDVSTLAIQSSRECFINSASLSRCLKLRLPIGNPMVQYIQVAYRNSNINNWFQAELIEKYEVYDTNLQKWYERRLSDLVLNGYSATDCSFDYVFCNDKQCLALAPAETSRVYNPFPKKAQGVFTYGEALAFYNYESGLCPLPEIEIKKFKVDLVCTDQDCPEEYVEIKIRAIIHNYVYGRNRFIWRLGGGADNALDDDTDYARFGSVNPNDFGYEQAFSDKQRNFIVYVEGTQYSASMVQWKSDALFGGNYQKWTTLPNLSNPDTQKRWGSTIDRGEFFYQEGTIKVKKGTRGFLRLCSHEATSLQPDTSTYVTGTFDLKAYKGNLDLSTKPGSLTSNEEIEFNTCDAINNVLDIKEAFIIQDNAVYAPNDLFIKTSSAYSGYVKDCNGEPVTGARVRFNNNFLFDTVTDFNGFYHTFIYPGITDAALSVKIRVEKDCSTFEDIIDTSTESAKLFNVKRDFPIVNQTYCDDIYSEVIVEVKNCNGEPFSGAVVALSGAKARVSTALGQARFRVRNTQNRQRKLVAILMDKNGCMGQDCNGICSFCMPRLETQAPACFLGIPIVNMGTVLVNSDALAVSNGLKKGGRFGFGFVTKGGCGDISFVNKSVYVDVPKACDNAKSICHLKYDFTGMKFSPETKCVSILRTENLNPFELQWLVDKVEYKDGHIVLTIQSLIDYNYSNGFRTNSVYEYLEGDRLEFVSDSENKHYCGSINYQVLGTNYTPDKTGYTSTKDGFFNQLVIEDDGRIPLIKKGTKIELQRPKACANEETYYTICTTLDVVNGQVVNPVGVFNTFDTYIITRKIGDNPPQRFEHHSPSDFWGNRVSDIGKPYVVNKYANLKRLGRGITVCDVDDYNSFGNLVIEEIGDAQMGDITAANIYDDKVIKLIFEHDNTTAQKSDNLIRINNEGLAIANTTDFINRPNAKISGRHGCQYDDIGSVFFGDGYCTWVDGNNQAYILDDFQSAEDVSFMKVGAWFSKKIQTIKNWNKTQTNSLLKYRWVTGINNANQLINLTVKRLRDSGVDNEHEPFISANETMCFRPADKKWYAQPSYTPESYARINLFDGAGCAFLCLLHGDAYVHPIVATKWNEFFGIAVDSVIGICMNKFPQKNKIGLSMEIQDSMMWFLEKVTNDLPNFQSEVPPVKWKGIKPGKWNASFLNDINGRGGLYAETPGRAGEGTRGYFIKCIFVRDNTDALRYRSTNDLKRIAYSELDLVFFKFEIQEQSGFSENL